MSKIVNGYLNLLGKYPWTTMSCSTGILAGGGDMISQFGIERKTLVTHDRKRTGRFFLYGFCITGPALRGWYMVLDKIVKGSGAISTMKKVALDQSCFAPTFCATFVFNMTLWRTSSVEAAKNQVKADFLPILKNNYKLWPAVQLVNFYFVPLQHRVMVVNIVALFWNTYLAWRTEGFSHEAVE